MIKIEKLNETFVRIHCDDKSIIKEIIEKFSFQDPNAKNNWKVKRGWQKEWKISLFNVNNHVLTIGLLPDLIKFLESSDYEYEIDSDFTGENLSLIEAKKFIETLNLPKHFEIRDYQLKYFVKCVRNYRGICLSPVSSGKSLLIYLLFRYFNKKTLLVVPSISLVYQMFEDFKTYGFDSENNIHLVMAGTEKNDKNKKLIISTWHSLINQDRNFFSDFHLFMGDEVHAFKAASLVNIMYKCLDIPIKIGFTGTLTGIPLYDFQIQGLFGPIFKFISTEEMIEQGYSSPLEINAILLNHTKCHYRDEFIPKIDYNEEISYLLENEYRNKFIQNLALSLKGNTFVMFKNIEHGENLYNMISKISDKPVYLVSGKTSGKDREILRKIIEKHEESITIASVVFATGINITSINNIIFVHPSKSRIKVFQSIGRGLRKNLNKDKLNLFDIADKLLKTGFTYTLNHFKERLKLYKEENFPVSFHDVNL